MEELMERYKIFMKRFELSDDFMAQMTVQQMNTQLGQFGMTPLQMFDQMRQTLDRMKSELDKYCVRFFTPNHQTPKQRAEQWCLGGLAFYFCHHFFGGDG
jgi:Domain of unknown function (DUF1825)